MSRLCPDCHATIWNEGAHAEACPGPTNPPGPVVTYKQMRGCGARRPSGFGLYTYCVLAPGHGGAHHYFADADG